MISRAAERRTFASPVPPPTPTAVQSASSAALDRFTAQRSRGLSPPAQAEAPRSNRQVIEEATLAQRVAVERAFQDRNGKQWSVGSRGLERLNYLYFLYVDDFAPFVRYIRNDAPTGPSVPLTADAAVDTATDLIKRNADLIGVPASSLDGLRVTDVSPSPAWDDPEGAFVVHFAGTLRQPGYEQFEGLANDFGADVLIRKDGSAGYYACPSVPSRYSALEYVPLTPPLTVSTTPGLSSDDPKVVQNVVGQDVYVEVPNPESGSDEDTFPVFVGKVQPEDIKSIKPTIHLHVAQDKARLTEEFSLAYEVRVQKLSAGPTAYVTYFVDATTGELIDKQQDPVIRPPPAQPWPGPVSGP